MDRCVRCMAVALFFSVRQLCVMFFVFSYSARCLVFATCLIFIFSSFVFRTKLNWIECNFIMKTTLGTLRISALPKCECVNVNATLIAFMREFFVFFFLFHFVLFTWSLWVDTFAATLYLPSSMPLLHIFKVNIRFFFFRFYFWYYSSRFEDSIFPIPIPIPIHFSFFFISFSAECAVELKL